MRSLLSNYFSRLKTIEDSTILDDELSENEEFDNMKTFHDLADHTNNSTRTLKSQLEELNMIKYIDDSDSLDSASNLMNEMSDKEEQVDYNFDQTNLEKPRNNDKETNLTRKSKFFNLIEMLNIQQMIVLQSKSNDEVVQTLEKVNSSFQNLFHESSCSHQANDSLNNDQSQTTLSSNTSFNEIKSWLCLVKKLTLEAHDQFSKKMTEKSLLPQIAEVDDLKSSSDDTKQNTFQANLMSRNDLESYNQILEEQVKLLKDRLKQVEDVQKFKDKSHLEEIESYKQACEAIRLDRKRLKLEKIDILNQTKELYKTIESKENEIRDFLKHYEAKTKETSFAVKKLIDSKVLIEKEKIDLQSKVFELLEERNELKLITESKNASITKLQKQIFELETKSARFSLCKETDFGYVSSKSRDTLSSSLIETITTKSDQNKKTKKEERSLKCKSNDFQVNGTKIQTESYYKDQNASIFKNQKLKNKIRNKSHHQLETEKLENHDRSLKEKKLNSNAFIDMENSSNEDLDKSYKKLINDKTDELNAIRQSFSSDCILKNPNQSTALSTALQIDKKIANQLLPVHFEKLSNISQETSCTSSIVSFTNSNSTNESSGISSTSNLPTSESISPKSNNSATNSTHSTNLNSKISEMDEKLSLSMVSSKSVSSDGSVSSESDNSSPLIMSESITVCEDDENGFNKTFNDFGNISSFSAKQPLSMSTSMHTPSVSCNRSSKVLNSIMKISTASSVTNNSVSAQQPTSIFSTVNTTTTPRPTSCMSKKSILAAQNKQNKEKLQQGSNISLTNSSVLNSSKFNEVRSKSNASQSLYSINDSNLNFSTHICNTMTSISKLNNSKIINSATNNYGTKESKLEERLETDSVNSWSTNMIKLWLTKLGMLPAQIKNAMKHIKNGKSFISLSDSDLEKIFLINNGIHKRKLKLAMEDLKNPEKCKYEKLGSLTNEWLCETWLKEIGLCQLSDAFKVHLVDGRVLASLTKKDIEKYFGLCKKNLQTSFFLAVDLLRKHDFDINNIKSARLNVLNDNRPMDVNLWTNENFSEWLKLVNLQVFTKNLPESGIHGALVVDNSFNVDFLYNSLKVGDETRYFNMKKILEDEIKLLKKTKTSRQEMTKTDSTFLRSLNSFRSDKIMSFRGSLGRALGKKIKRDISSPLIDDDTYKRIEYNHKIVDMKSFATTTSSAV